MIKDLSAWLNSIFQSNVFWVFFFFIKSCSVVCNVENNVICIEGNGFLCTEEIFLVLAAVLQEKKITEDLKK